MCYLYIPGLQSLDHVFGIYHVLWKLFSVKAFNHAFNCYILIRYVANIFLWIRLRLIALYMGF